MKNSKVIINEYERNMYHDSDFFAVVFDRETKTVDVVMYGTTRCGMDDARVGFLPVSECTQADVDGARDDLRARNIANHEREAKMDLGTSCCHPGDIVEIVKGRKYPRGVRFVFNRKSEWCDGYGRTQTVYAHSDCGQYKTNIDNVIVVDTSNRKVSPADLSILTRN